MPARLFFAVVVLFPSVALGAVFGFGTARSLHEEGDLADALYFAC